VATSGKGRRILVALASLALALVAAELVARRQPADSAPIRLEQFTSVVQKKHKLSFDDIFVGDPELFWRLRPSVVLPADARPLFGRISNGQGFRKERETALAKPPGSVRVLFLGDSCTFGYLLDCKESVAETVERELAAAKPGLAVECLNAGVPGFTLWQCLRLLELHGLAFQPDLVVVQSGWNEGTPWDGSSDIEQSERLRAARAPAGLAWSGLGRLLWRATHPAPPAPTLAKADKRPRLTEAEFRDVLARFRAVVEAAGADLLVLVAPCAQNLESAKVRTEYQIEQYAFAKELTLGAGGPAALVDGPAIVTRLAREVPAEKLFLDDVHTSALANERMARVVAERIQAWLAARKDG
jgi:lysophospholipase L1-like esterase